MKCTCKMSYFFKKKLGLKKNNASADTNETDRILDDLNLFLNAEIEYIQACLKYNFIHHRQTPLKKDASKKLNWTADKINLVELIYALFFSKCINNGNVKIKEIIEIFEDIFSIDLGEYYRTYVEIKRRKIIRGKFMKKLLDSMEEEFKKSDKK